MKSYDEAKVEVRALVGRYPQATKPQRTVFRRLVGGTNMITSEYGGHLSLEDRKYVVEISWGRFLETWLYGVTVIRRDPSVIGGFARDYDLSRSCQSITELSHYLDELNADPEEEEPEFFK